MSAIILLTPFASIFVTASFRAAISSINFTLSPGLEVSTVSVARAEIMPIFWPPISMITEPFTRFFRSGSWLKSRLLETTGNETASINFARPSGPSSNSWFPTAMAS